MRYLSGVKIAKLAIAFAVLVFSGCDANRVGDRGATAAFEFNPPQDFAPISGAPEEGILRFYGNKAGDSINISDYRYLQDRELTREVCDELVNLFNSSELRTALGASRAASIDYATRDGARSCYYRYEFQRPNGVSIVEYRVYQGADFNTYAITAVYDASSPYIGAIREAMKTFRIK